MARAGILGEDDRVELIDGKVVAMMPTENAHVRCVNRLTQLFCQRLFKDAEPAALLGVQNPVRLGPHQEPQPDVALLRPLEAGIATLCQLKKCWASRQPFKVALQLFL